MHYEDEIELDQDFKGVKINAEDWEEWREISDETAILMQYTGFADKNGREIYEGDIVTRSQELNAPKSAIKWAYGSWVNIGNSYNKIIIGNIYENPKLII